MSESNYSKYKEKRQAYARNYWFEYRKNRTTVVKQAIQMINEEIEHKKAKKREKIKRTTLYLEFDND